MAFGKPELVRSDMQNLRSTKARQDMIMKHAERFMKMSAIIVFAEGGFSDAVERLALGLVL